MGFFVFNRYLYVNKVINMKKFIKGLLRESLNLINEVDWEGDFSDTKASCVSPQQLANDMNKELDRCG